MRSFIAAAVALAAVSQAILLPPEVSSTDTSIVNALDLATDSHVVELECPGCPVQFKNRNGKVHVKTNKANHLSFLFKIESKDGHDRLVVNGFELYPNSDPFHSALTAPQTIDRQAHRKHSDKWAERHKDRLAAGSIRSKEVIAPQLGFSLQTAEMKDLSGKSEYSAVSLNLQIIEVSKQFVNGIPNMQVKLVKDSEGRLTIANVDVIGSGVVHGSVNGQKGCTSPLCQWLAFVKGRLGKPLADCPNKNKHSGAYPTTSTLQSHHKFHPGKFGHMHKPERTWAQLVKNVATHIIFPVLIGIAAGVGASLLGMMVGTLIITIWRTFVRKDRAGCPYARRYKAVHREVAVAEEKAGLMGEQSPPPAYDEPAADENVDKDAKEDAPEQETPKA